MIEVLKSGFYTTVQDLGRFGYRDKGVPVSGVMDEYSARKANNMLSNNENAALLEMTMLGVSLLFTKATYVAVAGATVKVLLNDELISTNQPIKIKEGDILEFGRLENGLRSYLAIKGGFQVDEVLGSASSYSVITKINKFKKGIKLDYKEASELDFKSIDYTQNNTIGISEIEVYKGPEFSILSDSQLSKLFGQNFSVSKDHNRMAYQLSELIEGANTTIITSATLPGTVQLTPKGKLIVLMKDGQTTGGYARILQLSNKAIGILSQKQTGDSLCFKLKKYN